MEMDQAQLVYCSFGIDCRCFYFLLSRGFDNLLELDDKGDVSARDNGSGLGRFSRLIQISAERLADESNLNFIEKSITKNNFSLYYNRANLRLVEDLEHNGWW
ncbi:hypothetical protein GQ457_09G018390 [Hibiscus cannabinus]